MKSKFLNVLKLSTLGLVLFFASCSEDGESYDPYKQLAADIVTIDNYLAQNLLVPVKDVNGVRMVINQLGTGLPATTNSTVKVTYAGKVLNSTTNFDAGTITGPVSGFITGWQIALTSLPAGSKATVFVPSPLGYANEPKDLIPANSILVFDVDFIEVTRSATEKERFTSDTTAINSYLLDKDITDHVKDASGVRYRVTQGAGPTPTLYDKVKVKLTFKLLSNDLKEVASITREPSDEFYSRVIDNIPGVVATLRTLPEGSKATAYIPSILGFASQPVTNNLNEIIIPANSNIIVEVELLDVL